MFRITQPFQDDRALSTHTGRLDSTLLGANQLDLVDDLICLVNGDGYLSSELKESIVHHVKALFSNGETHLIAEDERCRPIFVTFQAYLEEMLSRRLSSGELNDVKAYFLTPSPCTPLCKKGHASFIPESVQNDPARLYTVEKREVTLRNLMSLNGQVVSAYPLPEYGGLDKGAEALEIFEEVKNEYKDRLVDQKLAQAVPQDLVGAVYVFTDRCGESFTLTLQATQVHSADEESLSKWELLFSSNHRKDSLALERANRTFAFIVENQIA